MSLYYVSASSEPATQPSPSSILPSPSSILPSTNTIAITCVPKSFFDPLVMQVLRDFFAAFGTVNQWVPLPGFSRIICVFENDSDAEFAKRCDPIFLKSTHDRSAVSLRVYRADPNPLVLEGKLGVPDDNYLRPPALEKNFLISPPGSPPVGWESAQECPPNPTPLASDLMEALRNLQLLENRSSLELLLDSDDGQGVSVYVEDCDAGRDDRMEEDDSGVWVYGEKNVFNGQWRPAATAMPPISVQ